MPNKGDGDIHGPLLPSQSKDTEKPDPNAAGSKITLISMIIILTFVGCEVSKQTSMYSMQYFNHGKYPFPQTLIVVIMELVKLITTVIRAKGEIPSFSTGNLRLSLRFLVPSVLYAVNNNIYLIGLTLVAPPIWMILCSMRTAITATVYKVVLKRPLTSLQFMGVFFIVASVTVAKLPDLMGSSSNVNELPITAILLALLACANSVGAAVYTETLFKGNSKGETFLSQQFWLYFYGIFVASTVHFVSNSSYGIRSFYSDLQETQNDVFILFLFACFMGSIGGLVVASILKYLDNIVKEYSSQVANIMIAIVSSYLFPDKFRFTLYIILSLSFLLTGIYLYETKKVKPDAVSSGHAKELPSEIEK